MIWAWDRKMPSPSAWTGRIDLLVALYGVLKSGAYYVPISPATPADHAHFMLRDVAAKIVLTTSAEAPSQLEGVPCRCLDSDRSSIACQSDGNLEVEPLPSALMYAIYTSGSTGKPKGTMLSNAAVNHFFDWYREAVNIRAGDRVLLKTPITFDVSTPELFATLAAGATIIIADPDGHRDPGYLRQLVDEENITHIHFVPSMFRAFLDCSPRGHQSLRNIEVGGEALSADQVVDHEAQQSCPLINLYGPTEAAVWATYGTMTSSDGLTIGRPATGCPMYVLDSNLDLVPKGVAGDLYIGGVQLARGYRGRADLTADCFVPDPFSSRPGQRMYRTGDRARMRGDGSLEFLGASRPPGQGTGIPNRAIWN